jgi:hypothetical protein
MNLESADRLQYLKERVNWILMGKRGVKMNTYRFSVEQVIEVKANSLSEAEDSLPIYPSGFEGQAYYVTDESVELLGEMSA